MRISDWSSDVCSSDLRHRIARRVDDRLDRVRLVVAETQSQLRVEIAQGQPAIERAAHREGDEQPFGARGIRSEEHTSELQSLMRTSYAVFCLKKKKHKQHSKIKQPNS